jgi:hypothetical protein
LAAPGFLSWNTLVADLVNNIKAGVNPTQLLKRNSKEPVIAV